MGNFISEKEGFELDDFELGKAKEKKIVMKKTIQNTSTHKIQNSVEVNTTVAGSDPSSVIADMSPTYL